MKGQMKRTLKKVSFHRLWFATISTTSTLIYLRNDDTILFITLTNGIASLSCFNQIYNLFFPGIPSQTNGTVWMRCVEGIQNNDVIGIAIQQSGKESFELQDQCHFLARKIWNIWIATNFSILITVDLPMVQFFHNGEPLYDIAVNRWVKQSCSKWYLSKLISLSRLTDNFNMTCKQLFPFSLWFIFDI